MAFVRLRRLRSNQRIRDLVSQTKIKVSDLIMPYFAITGRNKREPIKTMPGIYRLSSENLIQDINEIRGLGIKAILLFGIAQKKDALGTEAYSRDGIVQKTIKAIKKEIKDIIIITDVCLCGYIDHGHCGIIKSQKSLPDRQAGKVSAKGGSRQRREGDFLVDNDETLRILAKIALSHAEAGTDFIAPSAMMDGQVKAIREALDNNGFRDTGILAYSAKYASNFYWPFREALDSRPQFGDRDQRFVGGQVPRGDRQP